MTENELNKLGATLMSLKRQIDDLTMHYSQVPDEEELYTDFCIAQRGITNAFNIVKSRSEKNVQSAA